MRRLKAQGRAPLALSDPSGDPRAVAILTTPHAESIAQMMADILRTHDYRVQIAQDAAGAAGFAHCLVISPQNFRKLPPNYIAFQLEQSINQRWFTPDYVAKLDAARAVLDYSRGNLAFLQDKGLPLARLFWLPIDTDPTVARGKSAGTRKGALFYGDAVSPRRKEILDRLKAAIPELQIATNLFGVELSTALRNTAVVVNVHFYDGALLETTRIHQALSHGAMIVSEAGADAADHRALHDVVDFAPVGDIEALIRLTRRALDDAEHRQTRLDRIAAFATRTDNRFRAGFRRFLLAQDMISFQDFLQAEPNWPAPLAPEVTRRICLTLPETSARRAQFLSQAPAADFMLWDGLRGQPGWRGAAFSHSQICHRLIAQGHDQAIICEDDVLFPADFEERLALVQRYLARTEWEMFSGFIADLHPEAKILAVEEFEGVTFVHIDRAVSMVFNILRAPVMRHLAAWDANNDNPYTNTIDRWLEARPTRAVVALPFLVGHRMDAKSTLRDDQITHYDQLSQRSLELLDRKVRVFRAGRAG